MVRILLVDEQKVIREGLRVLLESESDLKIVAAVSNGYAAIAKIEETNPDILFLSIKLSEIEGLDIIAIIRNKYTQIKIIVFTDKVNEQHLIQSLEMGVRGYLLKDTPLREMVEAIHSVAKGYTHVANTAYESIIPEISQTIAKRNVSKPDLIFEDTYEYRELPQWEIEDYEQKVESINAHATKTAETVSSESQPSQLLLMSTDEEESQSSFASEEKSSPKNSLNRYFTAVCLGSVGLFALSIALMSAISQRSAQIVIKNAVINGKLIPIDSPIQGKLTKVYYSKGASVDADSVVATIQPLNSDRYEPVTTQIQEQINLKQQQKNVAQQSLSFLESNLQNLEQELIDDSSQQLDTLLSSLQFNQIKHQETALTTAKIREDSARTNYENLQQMYRQNKATPVQLEAAKNSWDLAKLGIQEIEGNLESTRQEYQLLKQQLAGGKQQLNNRITQKIARLNQQIDNQRLAVDLVQKELNNLQSKLSDSIVLATEAQSIDIKSPISGAIYRQQYAEGEIVNNAEAIASVIDCQALWVEATVNPQVTEKINAEEPVTVTLADRDLSLSGKISLIESLNSDRQNHYGDTVQRAIDTQIPPQSETQNYSRVVVSVSSSVDLLEDLQFCSVGQMAQLSFGESRESLVSKWQPRWFSQVSIEPFQFYNRIMGK